MAEKGAIVSTGPGMIKKMVLYSKELGPARSTLHTQTKQKVRNIFPFSAIIHLQFRSHSSRNIRQFHQPTHHHNPKNLVMTHQIEGRETGTPLQWRIARTNLSFHRGLGLPPVRSGHSMLPGACISATVLENSLRTITSRFVK